MPTELIILNFGYAISIILNLGLAIASLIKGSKKGENITFFLASMSVAVFSIAYLFGVNVHNSDLSRFILLFTLINLFTVCFNGHLVFYAIGKAKEHWKGIIAMYASAQLCSSSSLSLILIIFFILQGQNSIFRIILSWGNTTGFLTPISF